jgi:hypothetical protein
MERRAILCPFMSVHVDILSAWWLVRQTQSGVAILKALLRLRRMDVMGDACSQNEYHQ